MFLANWRTTAARRAATALLVRSLAKGDARESARHLAAAAAQPGSRADHLRGQSLATDPGRTRIVSADRNFLAGANQVLLHDYRDLTFLKRVTASGVFTTLMSSSLLAYAVSFGMSGPACLGFGLQTGIIAMCLALYLRTCLARVVLDPQRQQLIVKGCGLFGEPLSSDQKLPLIMIEPGASTTERFIKFRLRGAPWDLSRWVWYRIPRTPVSEVGNLSQRASTEVGLKREQQSAGFESNSGSASSAPAAKQVSFQKRFPGTGLGGATEDGAPAAPSMPTPHAHRTLTMKPSTEAFTPESPRRSLANLRLFRGLPVDSKEEQKIIDFLEDPAEYAVQGSGA